MTLRPPLASLTTEKFLGHGWLGTVWKISDAVALKVTLHLDTAEKSVFVEDHERHERLLRRRVEESREAGKREQAIFKILSQSPHPNIVQAFYCAPEGIFLELLATSLKTRMEGPEPIHLGLRYRWLTELTSAAAWLEKLGLAHGDLRPQNLMLTEADHLKLIDFDCSVAVGQPLEAFTDPYWINKKDGSLDKAGPKSEQFAVGSLAYFIFQGRDPEIEDHERDSYEDTFPNITQVPCRSIIAKCWEGEYPSVAALDMGVVRGLFRHGPLYYVAECLFTRLAGQWGRQVFGTGVIRPRHVQEMQETAVSFLLESRDRTSERQAAQEDQRKSN